VPPTPLYHRFSLVTDARTSLRLFRLSTYFDTVRDCYEAVVIYTFFQLLVNYLGGEGEVSALFRSKRVKLLFPLNCFTVHSDQLYTWCKRGCLQYVIIRPVMTFTAVLAESSNVLCPGTLDPRFASVWINLINLGSVTVAMYTLVLVYVITSEKLQPHAPIPKFWAIKSIIFLSFWQQIIVVALQKAGVFDRFESEYFTTDNIADGIQNVCICIEMMFCAAAHIWAFTYKPYITSSFKSHIPPSPLAACCGRFTEPVSCFLFVLNPVDLWQDFVAFIKLKSAEVNMRLSRVTRHTSHVTRHTSHVTRHTSHFTRNTSGKNAAVTRRR